MTIHLRAAGSAGLRRAMTLVEMLIAMALTLILVYAIAEFYAYIGPSVKDGRAMIDLVAQLRTATSRLRADLELLTVPMRVFSDDGSAQGYFYYREGRIVQRSDALPADLNADGTLDEVGTFVGQALYANANVTTMIGDTDDILGFTIRSETVPFSGQVVQVGSNGIPLAGATGGFSTTAGSSTTAEVVWWTSFNDLNGNQNWGANEPRFLQRRQLLVAPELNQVHPVDQTVGRPARYYLRVQTTDPAQATYELMQQSDVAVRPVAVINGFTYFAANTLLDLTRRENRFMHIHPSFAQFTNIEREFPHGLDLDPDYDGDRTLVRWDASNNRSQWRWVLGGTRQGEDRLLSNVLSFDIRVFDPTAPIRADNLDVTFTNGTTDDDSLGTVQPGDTGWQEAADDSHPIVGAGAYVDLSYDQFYTGAAQVNNGFSRPPTFLGPVASRPAYLAALGATYDTWAQSYERDGINQDYAADGVGNQNIAPFDEGTDGFDNNGVNGVDDPLERETTPPYPVALRGIQVRVRVYEPTTRQVRQASIGWDFISE